jgi:general secretion pathway protein B
MSYILDALKKVERERHRPSVPTLGTVHRPAMSSPRRLLWPSMVIAVIIVNAAVWLWLLRSTPAPPATGNGPTESTTTASAPPAPVAAADGVEHTPRTPPETSAAGSAPSSAAVVVSPPSPESAGPGAPAPTLERPSPPPRKSAPAGTPSPALPGRAAPTPAPPAMTARAAGQKVETPAPVTRTPAVEPQKASRAEAAPSVQSRVEKPAPALTPPAAAPTPVTEKSPGSTVAPVAPIVAKPPDRPGAPSPAPPDPSMPDVAQKMSLQVLVYSETPSERLVFINNHKYTEGQKIEGTLVVENITPDGAILSYQGKRFLLRSDQPGPR